MVNLLEVNQDGSVTMLVPMKDKVKRLTFTKEDIPLLTEILYRLAKEVK
jgi:hypothetical protein